jgi:hypothetical protein
MTWRKALKFPNTLKEFQKLGLEAWLKWYSWKHNTLRSNPNTKIAENSRN